MYTNLQPTTYQKQFATQAGFSLIEVLVSLALFAIVVTMSVGTMVVMIDANSKAQFTQSIAQDISFALDSMTRDIRTGTHYVCPSSVPSDMANTSAWNNALRMGSDDPVPLNCVSGGSAFAFTEAGGSLTSSLVNNRIGFRLNTNTGQIERKLSSGGAWLPITSENVNVTELDFITRYSTDGDNRSPIVTIYVKGDGVGDLQETEFALQTTVTQRTLDI